MRKITTGQIGFFMLLLTAIVLLAVLSTNLLASKAWLGDFYGVVYVMLLVLLVYSWAFVIYRLFLRFYPLQEGYIEPGSSAEFSAQVNILFYLMLFNTLIRTEFLPVPLKTLVYVLLGTKIGSNSFSPGTILDPPLTELGDNTIIGHGATLYSHAIEGHHFSLERIVLGNNVTVGAHAIIMSGVTVGDGAIVSAGAVVKKGTHIGPGEHWGGVPARRLGSGSSGAA
ncbi:Galactoside O-acetyltransferase [Halioglobus japonicus]|nr:Galactoside O-acetyltransferase [Halioglobus japonicus]